MLIRAALLCLFSSVHSLGAEIHRALAVGELPELQQTSHRVLAAVTGIWDYHKANSEYKQQRKSYLDQILQNYRHACEHGYEVHVVLTTYESDNETLESSLPSPSSLFCDRLDRSLSVAVQRYPFEPLPNNTHGTAGTLAAKHRSLFADLAKVEYDCFIVQEDDLMVKSHHIDYFMRWSKETLETGLYPAFTTYEVPSSVFSRKDLASRHSGLVWRGGVNTRIFSNNGTLWTEDLWNPPVMHMLTREMLHHFLELGYHDPLSRHYAPPQTEPVEFNPWYNIGWIRAFYKPVVPVAGYAASLLHHAANKYTEIMLHEESETLVGLAPDQMQEILHHCTGGHGALEGRQHKLHARKHSDTEFVYSSHADSPCLDCLRQSQSCVVTVNYPPRPIDWSYMRQRGRLKTLHVHVDCVNDR